MKSDYYGNPLFQNNDIFDMLYQGKLDKLSEIVVEPNQELEKFAELSGIDFKLSADGLAREEFDKACQANWYMPNEYKNLDIEEFLVQICPEENYQRLIEELQEYRARNMLDLLRVLKYIVDTLREKNIVWGVGRGSSVASYVLFLLGVHKIDSLKYNLDWREFLR